ncbi:MAG: PQQ-binding-like beta-propeller repeat protein [Planctomycetes bacterium]|nr:PQQ-binding-like beta-propeller repeat protein [Planctomycetota bacterium]
MNKVFSLVCLLVIFCTQQQLCAAGSETINAALKVKELRHGLVVNIGNCTLTDALALTVGGKNLVQCLFTDKKSLNTFREQVSNKKLQGILSDMLPEQALPFVDHLVNTLIVENVADLRKNKIPASEMIRAVGPLGHMFMGSADGVTQKAFADTTAFKSTKTSKVFSVEKLWNVGMDDWSHAQKDASRSSSSEDTFVETPTGLRWVTGPLWTTYPVFSAPKAAFVTADGRNYYWTATGSGKKWKATSELTCVDAFNGLVLWKKEITGCVNNALIVATKKHLFVGTGREVIVFKARSGEQQQVIKDRAAGLFHRNGKLIVYRAHKRIRCYTTTDFSQQWEHTFSSKGDYWYDSDRVVLSDDTLFLISEGDAKPWTIDALKLEDGSKIWNYTPSADELKTGTSNNEWLSLISYTDGWLLALNGSRTMKFDEKYGQKGNAVNYAINAKTGQMTGKFAFECTGHGGYGSNIFYVNNLVWSKSKDAWIGWDPNTGKEKARTSSKARTRCYPDHLIRNKIMTEKMHFIDLKEDGQEYFKATRSACGTGFFPANGMVMTLPTRCFCFPMIRGFVGLSPTANDAGTEGYKGVLVKGSAKPLVANAQSDDWSTYRKDNARSSVYKGKIQATKTLWKKDFQEEISAPVIDNGVVYVSLMSSARIMALDQKSGAEKWSFTMGGRAQTPPSIYGDVLYAGSNDGWIYCLQSKDGSLVWKFRAAPNDRRMINNGYLESVWPVAGIMVHDGVVYAPAGRHTYTDGGFYFWAIDAKTGMMKWLNRGNKNDGSSLSDLPVTDGSMVYFGGIFTYDLKSGEKKQNGIGPALWTPMGFATDNTSMDMRGGTDNQRGQWIYADRSNKKMSIVNSKQSYMQNKEKGMLGKGSWLAAADGKAYGFYQDPGNSNAQFIGPGWSVIAPSYHTHSFKSGLVSDDIMFLAGEGKGGDYVGKNVLFLVKTADGSIQSERVLDFTPRWDGMAASKASLFISGNKGELICLGR